MKQRFFLTFCMMAALPMGACGSMFDTATQRVEFITPGVIGADCRAENENYVYNIYTPDIVTLERSYLPLTVTCRAEGYITSITEVKPEMNSTSYWNVLNGIIPGTAYDAGSRSIAAYPDRIEIIMEPVIQEPETIVPVYDEKPDADVRYIPPTVPYQADRTVSDSLTGKK